MPSVRPHPRIGSCLTVLLLLAGCGKVGNHANISGAVTLDGVPLAQGSILFEPMGETKGIVTGGNIENGRYTLSGSKGPAIGLNRVRIQAIRKTGRMVPNPMGPAGAMTELYESAIPVRFNLQSTLTVEVHPGDNTADFEVQSK